MSRAVLCCLLANVISGSTFAAIDYAHESGLPHVTFNGVRTAISALLFAAVAAARRSLRPRFSPFEWLLLFLVGVPGFALPLVLVVKGVALSTPGMGSILALVEPIAIVPLSIVFLRERPPAARLVGIGIGLAGALLAVGSDEMGAVTGDRSARTLGNLLLALQGAMWAIYTVAARKLLLRHPALAVSAWSTILGCAALLLVAPLEWPELRPASLDGLHLWLGLQDGAVQGPAAALASAFPWAAYLGVFGSFLAVLLWNAGLEGVPATRMAVFIFAQPAVGLVLNALLGEDAPSPFAWAGLALIAFAVSMVTREREPRAATE